MPHEFIAKKGLIIETITETALITDVLTIDIGGLIQYRADSVWLNANATADQVAVFTNANTIEGDPNFTWNGTHLTLLPMNSTIFLGDGIYNNQTTITDVQFKTIYQLGINVYQKAVLHNAYLNFYENISQVIKEVTIRPYSLVSTGSDFILEATNNSIKINSLKLDNEVAVDTIEINLTDDDTHLPTSGAVYGAIEIAVSADAYLSAVTVNDITDVDFTITNGTDVNNINFSHAYAHILSGNDEIDGDQLGISWNPTNYTPAVTPTEVTSIDHLTSHLYGIDQEIGSLISTTYWDRTGTILTPYIITDGVETEGYFKVGVESANGDHPYEYSELTRDKLKIVAGDDFSGTSTTVTDVNITISDSMMDSTMGITTTVISSTGMSGSLTLIGSNGIIVSGLMSNSLDSFLVESSGQLYKRALSTLPFDEYGYWGLIDDSYTTKIVSSTDYLQIKGGDLLTSSLIDGAMYNYELTINHNSIGLSSDTNTGTEVLQSYTVDSVGHIATITTKTLSISDFPHNHVHGSLTGLGDDDHTQYALLAGRSGGQTLYGGTASTDVLTIKSTSDVVTDGAYITLDENTISIGDTTNISPSVTNFINIGADTLRFKQGFFTGTVAGANALLSTEFVTKGQLDNGYVPYTGATSNVDLGSKQFQTTGDVYLRDTSVLNLTATGVIYTESDIEIDGGSFMLNGYSVNAIENTLTNSTTNIATSYAITQAIAASSSDDQDLQDVLDNGNIATNQKIQLDYGKSVYIGTGAGKVDDGTDNYNVGVGYNSLYSNTSGLYNVANGGNSLLYNTTGKSNTAIGYATLPNNTTGENNTALGHYASLTGNYTNTTALGANSQPTKDNQIVLGDANVTELKTVANIVAPSITLSTGATNNYVLTSDASGNGTWVANAGAGITPAAMTKVDDTNVTLTLGGTPATSLLQATLLTLGWTGTLADSRITSSGDWNVAFGWGDHSTAGYELQSNKGVASGYTPLNSIAKIPNEYLPALAITETFVVADETEMLALSDAETGDVAVRTDENKTYILQGTDYSVLSDWQELLSPTDSVQSVNGLQGTVQLDLGFVPSTGILSLTGSSYPVNLGFTSTDISHWGIAYDNRITSLTITGTSGAATLIDHVLNIPIYANDNDNDYLSSVSGSGNGAVTFVVGSITPDLTWDSSHNHGSFNNATTLTGASVYSLVTTSNGIVTDLMTRDLTPGDIGAQPAHGDIYLLNTTDTFTGRLTIDRIVGNASIVGTNYLILDSSSDFISLNHYANQDVVMVIGGGNVGIGTITTSAKLNIDGDVLIKEVNLSYQENLDVDSAAIEVIATTSSSTYDAVFFEYVVKNGTNIRAGIVTVAHDGTDVVFSDRSTTDLGTTTGVVFSVDLSGGDIRLLAEVPSDNWIIKTFVRAI